jgi:hypothetical protein
MPCGYQVVVLDASQDLTNPASIVSNRWQFLGGNLTGDWGVSYRWMYDDIANQLLASGDPDQQVVLVASFGMDAMAMPTPATVEQLIGRGAGTQLQQWLWVQTLSEGGGFIYYPCNYVLIGASGLPYAGGSEAFSFSGESDPIETTVTATLDNPTPPPSG